MPKKAKKGGGGKGGGKTEEERLLYMQQRAQAEEEMARKKEEILTLFLKDKLQKEERNTAVNLLKLNEGWRAILRQTRAAELRKDITVLSQTFERQLDGLQSIVKTLERDLLEAEHQSARVRRVHLQHMERLWTQQDKRMMFLQQQWESCLQDLCSTYSSERKQMLTQTQQQQAVLEDAAFTLQEKHEDTLTEIHDLYDQSMALYENAYEERTSNLLMNNQRQLIEKARRNQEALQSYKTEIRELEKLTTKNQCTVRWLETDKKNIKRMKDFIGFQRVELVSRKAKNKSVIQDLTVTKNEMNRKTHKLRDQLTQAQAAARKQLTDLTVLSDVPVKKLQAVIAKGERVLRVAEMCNKLENEQKNVFTSSSSTTDELRQEKTAAERDEVAKETSAFPELQPLMRRCNAALLQRHALKIHREDLSRENQRLKLLLRQHLDAMTVSDDTLDGRHALLTVRLAPRSAAPADTDRRYAVIEAVHAVKHSV
ncbi:dynein regulatory complex subunit 2 [Thunnus albacares]|uniref:dynein regulatory complex subunit 2 n=1 Tax=Thunnus albacares TaxID=8236 RepID=UPI001CF613F2|nr:dynein regulatory complex subunit 2 [Thunnus albacares]